MKNTILIFLALTLSVQFTNAQNTSPKGDYGSLAIDSRNGDNYGWVLLEKDTYSVFANKHNLWHVVDTTKKQKNK
jgi:hypothetical protein